MINNDYSVEMTTSGMVTSLGPDEFYESLETIAPELCLLNQDFFEPMKGIPDLKGNITATYSLQDQNYDINVAFHGPPIMQLNTMPPPPNNVYMYALNRNNTFVKSSNNKKVGWKSRTNNTSPSGYDSDESNTSQSSRNAQLDNERIKHKITRTGFQLRYDHANINNNNGCNDNYNNMYFNTVPLTHHRTNHFSKRCHSNNGKRYRWEYKDDHRNEITRRVHGLMERFTSKAKFFQIHSQPLTTDNIHLTELDKSIWNLYKIKSQNHITYFHKLDLWKKVYLHIKTIFDRYGLFMVGSTMTGLGTEDSDIDMCLLIRISSIDPRADALRCLEMLRFSLEKCDFAKSPEVIHAKVPILKFKGAEYGFEVDLNCNNAVGIRNTHLLHCYAQLDWRVRPLVIMVKLWAQANYINNAKNMTISSYSLVLMVIHFLQCGVTPPVVPCLHGLYQDKFNPEKQIHYIDIQEELPSFQSDNKQTLGELLLGFLQYYAYFDYETYAISVRLATRVPIDECRYARSQKNDPHQWKYLCIEEPFDLTNTARSVYDLIIFKRIQEVFKNSHIILRETANLNYILPNLNQR